MGTAGEYEPLELDFIEPDDALSLYFRDIRSISLLTRHEEVEFGKRIARGNQAQKTLTQTSEEFGGSRRS